MTNQFPTDKRLKMERKCPDLAHQSTEPAYETTRLTASLLERWAFKARWLRVDELTRLFFFFLLFNIIGHQQLFIKSSKIDHV